jgi:hypothetical protein
MHIQLSALLVFVHSAFVRFFKAKIGPKKQIREVAPRNHQCKRKRRAEGKSEPCLIGRILRTTKERGVWNGQQETDKRSSKEKWDAKERVFNDREWERVKMVNERDRCVGSTYPESEGWEG